MTFYHITDYTRQKARRLGYTVVPSHKPEKKIDVLKDGKVVASIGALGMGDYPTYLKERGREFAEERRRLYHARHQRHGLREYLARELLW